MPLDLAKPNPFAAWINRHSVKAEQYLAEYYTFVEYCARRTQFRIQCKRPLSLHRSTNHILPAKSTFNDDYIEEYVAELKKHREQYGQPQWIESPEPIFIHQLFPLPNHRMIPSKVKYKTRD